MRKFGKWIGAGLGWTIGGPIGALVGFTFGSFVDESDMEQFKAENRVTTKGDFLVSLLVLIASVMKADQKVMHSELNYVKNYLTNSFAEEEAREMLRILRDILKREIPLHDVTLQIKSRMDYPSRLQLVHLLLGITLADGTATKPELERVGKIAVDLGLNAPDIQSVMNMYIRSSDWAYKILEIEPDSSNEMIRKAYRQLALKNHPDKISYLGEEVRQKAQEKFQKISEAYAVIKKERGLN